MSQTTPAEARRDAAHVGNRPRCRAAPLVASLRNENLTTCHHLLIRIYAANSAFADEAIDYLTGLPDLSIVRRVCRRAAQEQPDDFRLVSQIDFRVR